MGMFQIVQQGCIPDWFISVREYMNEGLISGIDYLNAKMYLIDVGIIIPQCLGRIW